MPFDFSKIKITDDTAAKSNTLALPVNREDTVKSKIAQIYRGEQSFPVGNLDPQSYNASDDPTQQETGFWHTWFGDAIQRVNAGSDDLFGGLARGINEVGQLPNYAYNYAKTGKWEAPGKENTWLGRYADYAANEAEASRARSRRYGTVTDENGAERPKDFKDLWKEGDYLGAGGELFLTASESLPASAASIPTGGAASAAVMGRAGLSALGSGMAKTAAQSASLAATTGVTGVPAAIEKYGQLSKDSPKMPWYNRAVNAGASGAFEGLSEGVGALFDINLLKTLYKGAGLNKAKNIYLNTLPGTLKESGVEGAEEIANTVAGNVTDYMTGATDKFEPFKGAPESFAYGAAGGMQFAGPVGMASAAGQRRQQQYINGLITTAVDGSNEYFDFKNLSAEDKQAIQSGYSIAEERLKKAMENGSPEEFQAAFDIIGMSSYEQRKALEGVVNSQNLDESQKMAIFNYVQKGNARKDMEAAFRSQVEAARQQAVEIVKQHINPHTNSIITAQIGGKNRYITGKIILTDDGKIDNENSSKEVYYTDEETGKKQVVATNTIDIQAVIPAEEAIRQAEETVTEPIIAGQENATSQPYGNGETVRTQDGITGTVTGKNSDGTYQVAVPGVPQPVTVEPRSILQNLRGIENGATVDYIDANGNTATGEVEDTSLFGNGVFVIDGKEIPAARIIGLHRENQNDSETGNTGQNANGLTGKNAENEDAPASGDNKVSETDEQKRLFYESLPQDKKGEMDENAMTDAQKIRHLEYKRGIEFSVNAARKGKQNTEVEIKKLQSRFEKESDPLKLDKLQDQIDFLAERVKTYGDYISDYQRAKMQENMERSVQTQEQEAEQKRLLEEQKRAEAERTEAAGVPDVSRDSAANARRRGYRLSEGMRIDRQAEISDIKGTPVHRKFSDTERIPADRTIVEAGVLQPSHKNGSRNHGFFITEAQPKERTDDATLIAAENIAKNINPQEITGGTTAYTGSPIVNARGEVIQGNNRTAALQQMYGKFPEQAEKYKQYLAEHAADYGMTAEEIMSMERPVAVDVINASDEQAIRLGQLSASDTESGGVQRIQPKQAAMQLGENIGRFTQILFNDSAGEDLSIGELINKNADRALNYLITKGIINNTQYQSTFDRRQNITPEAKADLTGIATQALFSGASDTFAQRFDMLPAKAKAAILQTIHRDLKSSAESKITDDIRQAVEAYSMLSRSDAFANAKTEVETRSAVWAWGKQMHMDFTEGNFIPSEKYSNFSLELAVRFRVHGMATQRRMFNALYDNLQGTGGDAFSTAEKTGKSEAIKKHFNIKYNGDGLQGSHALADNSRDGTTGRQGSANEPANGEQHQAGEQSPDSGGGTERDNSGQNTVNAEEFVRQMEENAVEAPRLELTPENWYAEFGTDGTVETPLGQVKMGENQLAKLILKKRTGEFGMIKPTLTNPDVIIEEYDPQEGAERDTKLLFVKTFTDNKGKKYTHFESVTVRKNGMEVSISSHIINKEAMLRKLMNGNIAHINKAFSPNSSELRLAENRNGLPNLVSTQELNASVNKTTANNSNTQEKIKNNSNNETESNPDEPKAKRTEENGKTAETNNPAETQGKNAAAEELKPAPKTPAQMLEEAGGSIVKMAEAVVKQAEIAKAEKQVNTNATEGQRVAGNYQKGHVKIHGFDISIIQPKGSAVVDVGTDRARVSKMNNTYGYIRGTEGKDHDHGENPLSEKVFVVDRIHPETGEFSEHKVMMGFNSVDEARKAYLSTYGKGWKGLDNITETGIEDFRRWAEMDGRRIKPFAEYKSNIRSHAEQAEDLEAVNEKFNEELETLTPENADSKVFNLGMPSPILRATGITDNPLKLYGNKMLSKMRKHGFNASDIKNLPKAIANPIAVFRGSHKGSFSILTELNINGNNVLVTVEVGKDKDIDFNIITSTYGKSNEGVTGWINKGGLLYSDKEKTLNYLGASAPIADSASNPELDATKIVQEFENPKLPAEKSHVSDKKPRPVPANGFEKLIERLKETGLARNVIVDKTAMREYLAKHLGKEGAERFMTWYHGSINDFDRFERINAFTRSYDGIYFSNNKDIPKGYGDILYEVELPELSDEQKPFNEKDRKNIDNSLNFGKMRKNYGHINFDANVGDVISQLEKELGSVEGAYNWLMRAGVDGYTRESEADGRIAIMFNDKAITIKSKTPVRLMATSKGEIYGFTTPEGDVYLDPDKMNANTPIHEFGHLFWSAAMPAETKAKITELLKQTPGWESLSDKPAYANLKTDDRKADELFNTLLGNYGEYSPQVRAIMGDNIGLFARIQNAINEFLEWLKANVFGNTDAKLNVFAKKTLNELLSGKEIETFGTAETTVRAQSSVEYAKQEDYDFDVKGITEANAREMQHIKEAAAANGTFMKAPNGKATNLNERQWLQVRTKSFLDWFGDWLNNPEDASKVVDKNGEPMVVYHGTDTDFNEFKAKMDYAATDYAVIELNYFSDNKIVALSYGEKVIPVFLNIKNIDEFDAKGYSYNRAIDTTDLKYRLGDAGKFGNDGLVMNDIYDSPSGMRKGRKSNVYAVSEPNQIKSANTNNGNFDSESDNIRFMFAGEKGAANLDAAETEDVAREDQIFLYGSLGNSSESNNFAENNDVNNAEEKKKRIEKLRNSSPIEITGEEIVPSEDLKEYKANALEYGKSVRDFYTNKDTGEKVYLGKSGIKEVLQHDYKDVEQLQSVAAIPQIIENAIYIDTETNRDTEKNPKIKEYQYFVSGLKIGGVDYTVRSVIAVQSNGERYYDHKLSRIEKRKLLDSLSAITNHGFNQAVEFESKDSVLLSILQTNEEKILPESGIRFHAAPAGSNPNTPDASISKELDEKINNLVFRLREAWEDRHLAVKHFLDILREKGVEIKDHNDFYMQVTHQQGKNDAMLDVYSEQYQKPLTDALNKLENKGVSMRDIENYGMLKHGIERNAFKTQEAIDNGETPRGDYAGVLAVEKEVGKSAQDYIDEFERNAGPGLIAELWQRVNAATDFSLKTILDAGIIDKARYDELNARYRYYIPLRGHDAVTAEDLWKYFPDAGGNFSGLLLTAKGRSSRSETPFAFITQMAQSAIVSAGKNRLNQTMLRLARLDTTGMLTANRTWYINGVAQEADYSDDPDTYRENIERFEAEMEQKKNQGIAERIKGRLDVGSVFIEPAHKEQHAVHVFQNGKAYTVYVNGNPAVSQAINGTNIVDPHKDFERAAMVTRWMAANMTTRNPLFVASNFTRDIIFTSSILPVKEDGEYAKQFGKNIKKASGALCRYLSGKPDMNKPEDRYMLEYIMNGAKTGFSQIVNLQRIQKQIERDIKNGNKKNMFSYLSEAIGNMNDFAENMSRFSVYVTSREAGRSIIRSVSDAKEITVNFNRKGAGGYGASFVRPLYLFLNAGVQGFSNIAKVAVKNPRKIAALVASYCATGAIMPLMAALLGGDDAEEAYWKLPEWDRQSNLCIWTGKGFAKIPLPHELRVFHAIGDNAMAAIMGKKSGGDVFLDSAIKITDLIPNSPLTPLAAASAAVFTDGWEEAGKTAVAGALPDVAKPIAQFGANRDFRNLPFLNQWANKALPGYKKIRINKKGEAYAPSFLVDFAKLTDHATGGDGAKKGVLSFNPDEAQHLLSGYFGGLYTTISQTLDSAYKGILPDEEVKLRNTPFRRFYVPENDLSPIGQNEESMYRKVANKISGVNTLIQQYHKGIKETGIERGRLQQDAAGGKIGLVELAQKITELNGRAKEHNEKAGKLGTDEHWELSGLISQIKQMEGMLDELQGQEQKDMEIKIAGLKRDLIGKYRGDAKPDATPQKAPKH
jgi:hypothetical protein